MSGIRFPSFSNSASAAPERRPPEAIHPSAPSAGSPWTGDRYRQAQPKGDIKPAEQILGRSHVPADGYQS